MHRREDDESAKRGKAATKAERESKKLNKARIREVRPQRTAVLKPPTTNRQHSRGQQRTTPHEPPSPAHTKDSPRTRPLATVQRTLSATSDQVDEKPESPRTPNAKSRAPPKRTQSYARGRDIRA
uniref:Uncharacterized protein n=1 Tax=Mycena chlorophos TaxID=658473 RepID=A0ABQ0M2C8_MYCCL|nr:predicted protein [Mycena chlorophos]